MTVSHVKFCHCGLPIERVYSAKQPWVHVGATSNLGIDHHAWPRTEEAEVLTIADDDQYTRAVSHLAKLLTGGCPLGAYTCAFETVLAMFPNLKPTEIAQDIMRRRLNPVSA